ncbi:ParB/RepB/Spo0J family partition protein [Pseudoalteromonas sp. PPB1]|uniref:ParB/RepB/Spo0J family partition protein n=1 Tax=Pseudoalteromonas sp. PPB1 TaxID=2756136 RepID=UPI00189166EA|nr:ParB/RepB/Spo0J family partition protein [Pseudoalteromonas sp. PPB1]
MSALFCVTLEWVSAKNYCQGQSYSPEISGTIEPIIGNPTKGYLKKLVNGLTFGVVYGDMSSIQSLNADPEDWADIGAYEAQAGLEKYAIMALPGNAPKNIIKFINPKALISRQGRNEMTGSKVKRIRKRIKSDGYDESQQIDVADVNGKMIIIDGHHRAAAASAAQLKQVPVRVKNVSQQDADQLLMEAAEARY